MASLELTGSDTADFDKGEVYFIGNATTLIRFGGLTILTDPAFLHKGEHVFLGHGIWARREVEPACQIADLPPIDLVVLSHYHGDHFDDVAAQELDKNLPIVSTGDAVEKLGALGFRRGYPLDTWESLEVRKGDATVMITAMPGKHSTDEEVLELLMPVNGHLLDFSRNGEQLYRLYITGDTMLVDELADIPRRYPDIDLGLIHTGGTTFLVSVVTMTGEMGVKAVEITKPRTAIPIHYNDFSVFLSGLDDFKKAAEASTASTKFVYLAHGETYTFTPSG
ncbi:L-ascorbate metabolism protein UlaG, beta-lactamase superfamily [Mycobacterium rhizamassiliense]|jgi:L-ascorbate metabolism protein UlaG (beta-lactamase superfamily)|uniref:L-ascorbate metabolism protein UlaG, beta-lactamase superfamily n=1 Tax=Mycobacterium rhizamassiliense TaxID=1841860 RepID=A0A2U3P0Q8_9MYCO|nr:MBL fold metallo-hydrolase [Mycobacterium rhizamassiliense]SPM37341.1 L-ascorbate metabolism protein UlaG, beta-lactamase superfamily [Mycobacterium rhizamassiliense]